MRSTPQTRRQEIGCGFEPPPPPHVVVKPWSHRAYQGPEPTACVGYTRQLPIVIDVARTRLHWDKGAISEPLTDQTKLLIEVLETSANDVQVWLTLPSKEGGGGA